MVTTMMNELSMALTITGLMEYYKMSRDEVRMLYPEEKASQMAKLTRWRREKKFGSEFETWYKDNPNNPYFRGDYSEP